MRHNSRHRAIFYTVFQQKLAKNLKKVYFGAAKNLKKVYICTSKNLKKV